MTYRGNGTMPVFSLAIAIICHSILAMTERLRSFHQCKFEVSKSHAHVSFD
ncbi:uncharacterized protein BDW47DRAFT_101770, partial [Aspergillus candidus]